jgi:hypothetical protein
LSVRICHLPQDEVGEERIESALLVLSLLGSGAI